jgi:hypothetical protein
MFLFANYLKLITGNSDGPATPEEMNTMLPNVWHKAYLGGRPFGHSGTRGYREPTPYLAHLGLHDITRAHYEYMPSYWGRSPILHLYRNPFDYAVSIYHYKFKHMGDFPMGEEQGVASAVAGPADALDIRFDDYVKMYLSYRSAARGLRSQLLRISYEDLRRYPEACLRMIIRWLGREPEPSQIQTAVYYSSIKTVNQLEGAGGLIHPDRIDPKIKFARDGSIGQWKEYFTNKEVTHFKKRFADVDIDLDEFTLDS